MCGVIIIYYGVLMEFAILHRNFFEIFRFKIFDVRQIKMYNNFKGIMI